MSASPRSRLIFAAALTLALMNLPGCSEDTTKPEVPPVENPRSTMEGVIALFEQAHAQRSIEDYSAALHPDYLFRLLEDDRWGCPFPQQPTCSLERTDDVRVTETMFTAESVTQVRLKLRNITADADTAGFWVGVCASGEVLFVCYWATFAVDLHMVEVAGDQEIDHWVDGRANVFLRRDPDNESLWTIWKIKETGFEHLKTEPTTWSNMKMMFW